MAHQQGAFTEPATVALRPDQLASQRQLRYLQAVAREAGYDMAALDNRSVQEFGVVAAALSRRDASTLIDLIETEARQWGGRNAT